MFERDRDRFYPSYADAWRAACMWDAAAAVRRNLLYAGVLAVLTWVWPLPWVEWLVFAGWAWLGFNTVGWLKFRRKARLGLIYPPGHEQRPAPFGPGRERHG